MNSYRNLEVLMFYRLGKKSEKSFGGVATTPTLVRPRVKTPRCSFRFSYRFVKNPVLSDFSSVNARVQPSERVCNFGVNQDKDMQKGYAGDLICWKIEELSEQGSP